MRPNGCRPWQARRLALLLCGKLPPGGIRRSKLSGRSAVPTRHFCLIGADAGHFFDPSGNRNEVFAGGFIYYPDNPKRVWSMDKIGKAIFYYQRELNERFMSVVT